MNDTENKGYRYFVSFIIRPFDHVHFRTEIASRLIKSEELINTIHAIKKLNEFLQNDTPQCTVELISWMLLADEEPKNQEDVSE